MSEQSWYGWIPIITPEVAVEYASVKLQYSSQVQRFDEGNDYYIVPENRRPHDRHLIFPREYRRRIRTLMGLHDTEKIYFSIRDFADGGDGGPKRYAFGMDEGGRIKSTCIGPLPSHSTEAREIDADSCARVLLLDPAGLVNYKLDLYNLPPEEKYDRHRWEAITGRYHFEIIRDIYHDHVYHHEGDFLLLPVAAYSTEEALDLVCKQYSEMVINAHKLVKRTIKETYSWTWVGYIDYVDALRGVIHARGNMVYCNQFHKLYANRNHESCAEASLSFVNAEKSLALQQEELEKVLGTKILSSTQQATYWLTMIAIFLSVEILLNSLEQTRTWDLSIRILLGALCATSLWMTYWGLLGIRRAIRLNG